MKSNILLITLCLIPLILASLADAHRGFEAVRGAPSKRSSPIDEVLSQVEHLPTTLQPRSRKHLAERAEQEAPYHPDESYQGKTAPKPLPHHGIVIARPTNGCYLPGHDGKMYHICRSPNRSCPLQCQSSRPPYSPPKPNSP